MTDPTTESCCAEYAALSRRGLLTGALALAGSTTLIGSAVVQAAAASATPASSVLVVLSLRGAADGLSLVVPHADPVYYQARPRLAIPADRLLVRDDMFGLHPALAPLVPLWNAGKLAAVHATGLPSPNRSHFAAMEEVEDSDPGSSQRVGWLNRLIGTQGGRSPLKGLNLASGTLPAALYGAEPVMSAGDLTSVRIAGDDGNDPTSARRRALRTLWDQDPSPLGRAMRSTFESVKDFEPVAATSPRPANGAKYPDSDLGRAMSAVARVVRGNVGVEVITVDQGDWDMHAGLGTADSGRMLRNAGDFGSAVAAFFSDLGRLGDKVTLVALSEFGRRVVENANMGLDHGYGNVMFVAGAGVRGGYHGTWTPLEKKPDSDVLVTTDYRSVLSEVVSSRFGASPATVFPGFPDRQRVGVMTGQ